MLPRGRCGCNQRGCRRSRCALLLLLGCLFIGWLIWLIRCRRRPDGEGGQDGEMTVPSWAYRRPDPLIYSQQYLQSLGYAVTWDNPDIQVEQGGVVVDQHDLRPGTAYEVVSRIWNGSTSGPAVDLPVHVSYLDFGIGTVSVPVGSTTVDLPVKGAPGHPAFARVPWTTPATPGHYCLQVQLDWPDDANPANNLGQSNTDVKALNSPHAAFTFPLRNNGARARVIHLVVDAYVVPPLPPCDDQPRDPAERRRQHDPAAQPVPDGWRVAIEPHQARLGAGESIDVTVDLTAPDGFSGERTFNVHGYDGANLVGGVTLTVAGTG